ncbi:ATP-binding cassette sub-family C member 9 [Striga asiatica]|uniref:ATP-binding cassette sub-family C member 9 n=1 Tax=Striga asiatica TaxID=4170 RepID=A0A5A7P1N1_STRAF|nr:ATP-binding cassette sub-family C member 9 [Striga asiatica]
MATSRCIREVNGIGFELHKLCRGQRKCIVVVADKKRQAIHIRKASFEGILIRFAAVNFQSIKIKTSNHVKHEQKRSIDKKGILLLKHRVQLFKRKDLDLDLVLYLANRLKRFKMDPMSLINE